MTADDSHPTLTRYAEAARRAGDGGCVCVADGSPFGAGHYGELDDLPDAAVRVSLGCGNPTAVAELHDGETVLDLGSGGGLDVLLSARRVGSTGFVYGLDATAEMVALARRNATDAGVGNVEILHGTIEHVPLEDSSVDVVISNCVIVLATDKDAVFSQIARVLRVGGRVGDQRHHPPRRRRRRRTCRRLRRSSHHRRRLRRQAAPRRAHRRVRPAH